MVSDKGGFRNERKVQLSGKLKDTRLAAGVLDKKENKMKKKLAINEQTACPHTYKRYS